MLQDHLLKTKNENKDLKKQEIQELNKAYFQHDIAFENVKDLSRSVFILYGQHLVSGSSRDVIIK